MKINVVHAFVALCLGLFFSCSKEQETETEQAIVPVAEVEINVQAELLSDQLDDIADAVLADEFSSAKSGTSQKPSLPECVVVTTTTQGDVTTRVVDFGTGCSLANGLEYSGKLIMVFTRDLNMRKSDVVVETDGFYINDLAVSGRKEITRTWPETVTAGVPSSVVVTELRVEHPDGFYAEVTGTTTREWIEGYGSGVWGDNVVLIGGTRTVKTFLREALLKVYAATITDKLRREWSCRFIVSGVVAMERGDFSAVLDYGDGSCDNKALLTANSGISREIVLR